MVSKMPEHFKKNFVYRKVFNDIWYRKKNASFIVAGATGSGKSSLALRMAEDLDKTFSVERVVYSAEDFLKLIAMGDSKGMLNVGSAILFDEISHDEGADSRSSLSKTNKTMASLSTIYRAKRLIVFFVAPNLNQIDNRVRAVSITGLLQMKSIDYKREKSFAEFFWSVQNSRSGEVYYKRPRLLKANNQWITCSGVWFNRPSKELEASYEKKKMEFIDLKIKNWYSEVATAGEVKDKPKVLTARDLATKLKKNKDKFIMNNRFSPELIIKEFNCGVEKARMAIKIAGMD